MKESRCGLCDQPLADSGRWDKIEPFDAVTAAWLGGAMGFILGVIFMMVTLWWWLS